MIKSGGVYIYFLKNIDSWKSASHSGKILDPSKNFHGDDPFHNMVCVSEQRPTSHKSKELNVNAKSDVIWVD